MDAKTSSARETKIFAQDLAKKLSKKTQKKHALVLALIGDLGSGKTTFTQGFLRALGIRGPLTSPTFILIKRYPILKSYKLKAKSFVYHLDCYRIKKPRELLHLGLKEILTNPENIVLVEWAERIKKVLPKNALWLKFEHGEKENERIIKG